MIARWSQVEDLYYRCFAIFTELPAGLEYTIWEFKNNSVKVFLQFKKSFYYKIPMYQIQGQVNNSNPNQTRKPENLVISGKRTLANCCLSSRPWTHEQHILPPLFLSRTASGSPSYILVGWNTLYSRIVSAFH